MNAYRIEGPALIQFSGGRSSGFMLRQIIDAHSGSLPADVLVTFANTGLEHAATYDFVARVESEWGVPIHWLEFRWEEGARFSEVRPETASRQGEPFEAMIRSKGYLPNPVMRLCTSELKIKTAARFGRSLGWDRWTSVVGLRADEPRRVSRARGSNRERWTVELPMAAAGHELTDVRAFWATQPFDLELPNNDNAFGNCVGCFLKSRARLLRVMRADPTHFDWWTRMESLGLGTTPAARRFRSDRPDYRGLLQLSRSQRVMFEEDDTLPCMCHD